MNSTLIFIERKLFSKPVKKKAAVDIDCNIAKASEEFEVTQLPRGDDNVRKVRMSSCF